MTTDEAIRIIEANSVMRATAFCDDGSAFLLPINVETKAALDAPKRFTRGKLIKLAELLQSKPEGVS